MKRVLFLFRLLWSLAASGQPGLSEIRLTITGESFAPLCISLYPDSNESARVDVYTVILTDEFVKDSIWFKDEDSCRPDTSFLIEREVLLEIANSVKGLKAKSVILPNGSPSLNEFNFELQARSMCETMKFRFRSTLDKIHLDDSDIHKICHQILAVVNSDDSWIIEKTERKSH